MSQSKYLAGFGVMFWDTKSQAFLIPIYSTSVLHVIVRMIVGGVHKEINLKSSKLIEIIQGDTPTRRVNTFTP